MTNRLAHSTSPYLLQHAQNPVDWWEFEPAAFAEARSRDVPVLLSVGYAACHWCHVMAHESFEDPAVGAYINEHFVALKVDREQRPDVDALYMSATQLLTQQGGWPMTVFLTPQGQAFHAGTYYPPRPVQGRPSFMQVLRAVQEAWAERRERVMEGAQSVTDALQRHPEAVGSMLGTDRHTAGPVRVAVPDPSGDTHGQEARLIGPWLDALEVARDSTYEGFGNGPKFPPSPVLETLVLLASRDDERSARAAELLTATLDAMVTGALHDHVGGGFFRYSVTPDWSLPHYEKMLYDNAQLLRVLAHTARYFEERGTDPVRAARYRNAAEGIVTWLAREMITEQGAIAASLDADSDPFTPGAEREGAYYTFSRGEGGAPRPAVAAWGESGAVTGILDQNVGEQLWEQREQRTPPERDDKVVTAWNGMAIAALAEAAVLLDQPAWLETAEWAAEFLWTRHWDPDTKTLARTSRRGTVDSHDGQLEDYVRAGLAMLALYRATGLEQWYARSLELAGATVEKFMRGDTTMDSAEPDAVLVDAGATGQADPFDDVAASAQSCLARWLVLLGQPEVAGRSSDELVDVLVKPAQGLATRAATAAGGTLHAWLLRMQPPALLEVVHASEEHWDRVQSSAGKRRVTDVLVLGEGHAPYGVPEASSNEFAVWLCRNGQCELPVRSPEEVSGLLDRA
ncbi:thioredoxin domain-containing protein [Kocuria sp. cx-116]|uniref:thioredoxin domain-containing protein n=1 Tax=Kocuria sp. cx-116 TaxID=2771378 RepID=UPI001685F4E7|nr:thioredoxin domain-containing protein [Kocuria sp. cx-116]MBD2762770.1 thioredoxin domain-containing protein [Kocuria sp. cx-116]